MKARRSQDLDQRGQPRNASARGCDVGAYDTGGAGGSVHATYYVAPSGAGAGGACSASSKSKPFATIQEALACAVDGDLVKLAPSGSTPYPGIGPVAANVTIEAGSGGKRPQRRRSTTPGRSSKSSPKSTPPSRGPR